PTRRSSDLPSAKTSSISGLDSVPIDGSSISKYLVRRPLSGVVARRRASMMLDLPALFSPTRRVRPGLSATSVSSHDLNPLIRTVSNHIAVAASLSVANAPTPIFCRQRGIIKLISPSGPVWQTPIHHRYSPRVVTSSDRVRQLVDHYILRASKGSERGRF